MKKTIILITSILSFFATQSYAQSIQLSPPGRGTAMGEGCTGSGLCNSTMSPLSSSLRENVSVAFSIYKNRDDKVALKIPKSLIDKDLESLLLGKDAYFLEHDELLDRSVQSAFDSTEPLIIARGWHPIVELEDCFVISYTLKK